MDERQDEVRRILADVERRLEGLERAGVRLVNVPAPPLPPALSATLPAPSPPVPGTAPAARPAGAPQGHRPRGHELPTPAGPAPPPLPAAGLEHHAAPEPPPGGPAQPQEAPPDPSTVATLESLRFQFRACQACKLGAGRTRLVFGVGHDRPPLLFIGEGPGAEEDAQGLPFVGRAGALLTGLIAAMGLVREDVYITNVVKCRPPGNRNPEPDEVARCRPILERQIELLDPRLVITLGNVPLKVLKPGAGGITRERGQAFQYRQWTVLPTFHPSYLLRNPAAIPDCWSDLRQAMQRAYPEP